MTEGLLLRAARAVGGVDNLAQLYTAEQFVKLLKSWELAARPEQLEPPGDWRVWLLLAGRGNGKSRTGSETMRGWVQSGRCGHLALVGATAADARDVMVEGPAGILRVCEREGLPAAYEPSKRRVTWPNGATATVYSAEEPDRLRGPAHDGAWCDELAAWSNVQDVWDQLQFGLRLGTKPRTIITTTPRPIPLIRKLLRDPDVHTTRGRTIDNEANLPPSYIAAIRSAYEGTRLGRQELDAEILDDNPGALWRLDDIDRLRVKAAPQLRRIVIGIDPAVSSNASSDETGIIAAGVGQCWELPECQGADHAFVLEDRSGIFTPAGWAAAVAGMYERLNCDRVCAEINNGGAMVEATLRAYGNAQIAYTGVHASKGKVIRAEPIAALYEQGKVHHVGGLSKLEDQLTQWDPVADGGSPDRLDALVWGLTELLLGAGRVVYTKPSRPGVPRRI
jgi:phage terminase large subunit-like protein